MVLIRHQALVHTDADAVMCMESSNGTAGTRQDALEVIVIRPAAARRLSFSTAAGAAAAARRETGGLIRRETDGHRICHLGWPPPRVVKVEPTCAANTTQRTSGRVSSAHTIPWVLTRTLPCRTQCCGATCARTLGGPRRPPTRRTAIPSGDHYVDTTQHPASRVTLYHQQQVLPRCAQRERRLYKMAQAADVAYGRSVMRAAPQGGPPGRPPPGGRHRRATCRATRGEPPPPRGRPPAGLPARTPAGPSRGGGRRGGPRVRPPGLPRGVPPPGRPPPGQPPPRGHVAGHVPGRPGGGPRGGPRGGPKGGPQGGGPPRGPRLFAPFVKIFVKTRGEELKKNIGVNLNMEGC